MAEVTELKQDDFAAAIAEGVTLVDFWAPWCSSCRMQGTVLDKIAPAVGDKAKVCKVNVDECPDVAAKYNVQSIPALIVFKNGEIAKEFNGLTRGIELQAAIDAAQ